MGDVCLRLIYHSDQGRWNAIWDIAHKMLSPSSYPCTLCTLTHGTFREHRAWTVFRRTHPGRLEVFHRDEYRRRFPQQAISTPCVLIDQGGENWVTALTPLQLSAIDGAEALTARLQGLLDGPH